MPDRNTNDDDALNLILQIFHACGDGSEEKRADRLLLAWQLAAVQARDAALPLPDGFTAVRARQVAQLRRIADIVAAAEPDLEGSRLVLDGDLEGLTRHAQRQIDEAFLGDDEDERGDEEDTTKGGA
jgi:hypothetical protein